MDTKSGDDGERSEVDEEHLRAAVTQLNSASTPVAGACDATDACGSTTVQAALGEVETIVRRAGRTRRRGDAGFG
jgi:hypothetical protein